MERNPPVATISMLNRHSRRLLFLALAVLILTGTALYLVRSRSVFPRPEASSPPAELLLPFPRTIVSDASFRQEIDQASLETILTRHEPFWEYRRASDVLHALRLWGPDACFPSKASFPLPYPLRAPSSKELLSYFLEERGFQEAIRTCRDAPPAYFFPSQHGWGVRKGYSDSTITIHQDDFLELAAELGLSSSAPLLKWEGVPFRVADVFAHSFAWFSPDQELEFTAVACAHYLTPGGSWRNRFGVRYSLDDLAQRLIENGLPERCCYGIHVPYALAVLASLDRQESLLSKDVGQAVRRQLQQYSQALVRSQGAAGWWDRKWHESLATAPSVEGEQVEWVRSTGHHLEWIALVDPELRPPEATVRRAIHFLLPFMRRLNTNTLVLSREYCPCSHAARALVLLSGRRTAAEVMQQNWAVRNRRDGPPPPVSAARSQQSTGSRP